MVNFYYDKEADVFYFPQGKPRVSDETVEAGEDVLLRINPRTKKIRGFTLLNASRRARARVASPLPFTLTPAATR